MRYTNLKDQVDTPRVSLVRIKNKRFYVHHVKVLPQSTLII